MGRARVIAVHRYYWPDTPPYASMLRSIVTRWAGGGREVTVLSTQPSYKPGAGIESRPAVERLDGVTTRRVRVLDDAAGGVRKLANVVVFPVAVVAQVLRAPRPDVVMCSTAPPVVLAAAVSLAARLRRAEFIYHCMDLHPQIGALTGEFANPVVYRALDRVDRATCRRAAAVVVLSEDMRRVLLARDPSIADRVVVLNNFDLPDHEATGDGAPSLEQAGAAGRLRVVFTGNVGRFQGLDSIVRAVAEVDGVELTVMGEGRAKPELQALTAELAVGDRVHFRPHGSVSAARALLRTADLGLVSLVPQTIRYAYPSKTMTYLAEGLPLLVHVEPDSELSRLVTSAHLGFTCAPGDVAAVVAALRRACDERASLPAMRARARATWQQLFAPGVVLDRWDELLADVHARRVPTHLEPARPEQPEVHRG